jgi:hypothetical protein
MLIEFSGDELILALVSLIRATNPSMLRQGLDGFTVDFDPLERKQALSPEEESLLKFRAALEGPATVSSYSVELTPAEARQVALSLEQVEFLQPWPADVLQMSRQLRARLAKDET